MNNQNKSILMQWVAPTAVFVLALLIILATSSNKSRLSARTTVNRNIETTADNCARTISDEITLLEKTGRPVAQILARSMEEKELPSGGQSAAESDLSQEIELLNIAKNSSSASMAYICDKAGNAVNDAGESFSAADSDFFERLYLNEGSRYLYTFDMQALIVAVPIDAGRENELDLLLFYPLENMEAIVKKFDFNIWSYETLVDREGNIIANYGHDSGWEQGGNALEVLKGVSAEASRKMKSQMNSNVTAVIPYTEDMAVVYASLGAGNLALIFGLEQSYIDRQVELQWATVKQTMTSLVVVLCIFIVFVVAVTVVGKIINNRKQEQLEVKADTDLLTGLNNKLATECKIKEFISQNPDAQSMMFIFDIDNFKKINDTMGHAFGDEVLRSLGQQIRVIFRASDIVGRAGGDEFIVFLKNITEEAAIRKEARKVEDFFKDFKAGEYTKYSATASIGVAIYPQEGADFESLYKAADSALYKAKKRGKNQLAFYNEAWAGEKPAEEKPAGTDKSNSAEEKPEGGA